MSSMNIRRQFLHEYTEELLHIYIYGPVSLRDNTTPKLAHVFETKFHKSPIDSKTPLDI